MTEAEGIMVIADVIRMFSHAITKKFCMYEIVVPEGKIKKQYVRVLRVDNYIRMYVCRYLLPTRILLPTCTYPPIYVRYIHTHIHNIL